MGARARAAATTVVTFYRATVGKKIVMAVTAVILVGFVAVHMLGNLQIFAGAEKMNAYAAFLKSMPAGLWGTRLVVGLAALVHVVTATQLILLSLRSRPDRYARKRSLRAGYMSRTMRITGPLLLVYIVYHLLHLTVGILQTSFDPHDVYGNVIASFSSPAFVVPYIVAMAILGLHIGHGIWSAMQTLGLGASRLEKQLRVASIALAVVIAAGFMAIPVAVVAGILE